jgi:hypothetical protein
MDAGRLRAWSRLAVDAGAVLTALLFLGSYFPSRVMLSPTTTNGGDMASHYYPLVFLREVLLPQGSITGWSPGSYAGFPLFQFYFPLSFVLMAAASLAVPLAIAFKLGTVLGTFLLPPAAYLSLRLARVPFPGPALGALATLCFLFMEANSAWGGNIPSTLAGEFTFSLGLALAVLFVGSLRRTVVTGRGGLLNGALIALIGLTHGYTLLWAGFTSLVELVALRGWWRRVGILVAAHGLAILLIGFWLFPLLAYAPWTTAYGHVWVIHDWREIMPPILWPAAIVAVVTSLLVGVFSLVRREPLPRSLVSLWWGTAMGGALYFTASLLHVVDIRFLPFSQLGLCLLAAAGTGHLVSRLPAPEMWPLVGALAILPFVQSHVGFIPSWIRWNYSGFETKATWPIFRGVNEHLRGTFRDPRVVAEHSPDHEALGTIRAFESLPLFSGRSTLEGLYMQASPTAPFVFYTQSEVSTVSSCPFPDYGCSRLDLVRGVEHMRMFNVSQYIVRSAEAKAAAARHPGLEKETTVGPYEIWRLNDNDGRYVVPLETAPAVIATPHWKAFAYRWFKSARPGDPVPVFVKAIDDDARRTFAMAYASAPAQIPRQPLGPPPALRERLERDRIIVTGARPGHPILVRVSYHPRWRATTGERVWLAAPSFMLVVPKSERVELVYGSGPPVVIGQILSVLGLILLVGGSLPAVRRLPARLRPVLDVPPLAAAVGLVRRMERWSTARRAAVLGLVLAAVAALLTVAAVTARTSDADSLYRKGQRLYDAGRLRDALPYFHAAQRAAPLSNTAIHSTYYESIILFRERDWPAAEEAFRRLVETYPEASAAPEALYHVGLCRIRAGDVDGAARAWTETRERWPETQWARDAGERLREVAQRTGA